MNSKICGIKEKLFIKFCFQNLRYGKEDKSDCRYTTFDLKNE